ncbi:MAG: general secretion pathway protein GspF, partial [Gammaproteobacteria bacterium]
MGKYIEERRRRERLHRELEQRIEADCRRSGHARPTTRREFLGRGLISGVSTVFLPSLAGMLAREAYAQTGCVIDNNPLLGAGKIPFIGIDQGGGANIAGSNVIVGGAGGQEDFISAAGYARLGLPNAIIPQSVGVDRSFGIAMHPNSALLRGMLDKTSPATRANVNGTVIPARSENDTDNNPHNPIYGIARAGANGEFAAT